MQNKNKENISLIFNYKNSVGSHLMHNKDKSEKNMGVYYVPCMDCDSRYFGETGRSLEVRIGEHKRACRLGTESNMIAKHSWDLDHRINWKESKLIYKESNIGKRRVVEGALIGLFDTFKNNKAFTQEDSITNWLICKSLNIDVSSFSITPSAQALSLSSAQVLGDVASSSNAGTDAVNEESSNDSTIIRTSNEQLPRRSARLAINYQEIT